MTEITITRAIRERDIPDYQQLKIANRIFNEGRVLFAILIWRNWQHSLTSFVEHDTLDSVLPMDVSRAESIVESFRMEFAQRARISASFLTNHVPRNGTLCLVPPSSWIGRLTCVDFRGYYGHENVEDGIQVKQQKLNFLERENNVGEY